MNIKQIALRAIYDEGLPLTLRLPGIIEATAASMAIKRAADDLALAVEVDQVPDEHVVTFTVTKREKTEHEKRKELLATFNFPTYADYVRFQMDNGSPALVNHFGMSRRAAHAAIRFAVKPGKVTIKKKSHAVSEVTALCN